MRSLLQILASHSENQSDDNRNEARNRQRFEMDGINADTKQCVMVQ